MSKRFFRFIPTAGIVAVLCITAVLFLAGCASAPEINSPGEPESKTMGASGKKMPTAGAPKKPTGISSSLRTDTVPYFLGIVRVPGDSYDFWTKVMSPDVRSRYQAQGYRTFCNKFVGDMLLDHFDQSVYRTVFPNGVLDPNVMHNEWKSNPKMVRLGPDKYSIRDIQDFANAGYLVLLSYTWTYGHLAFVGNEEMRVDTIPPSPMINGQYGNRIDPMFLPIVVQAGTYTGVTSVGYASNGWIDSSGYPLFRNGTVRFYLVKEFDYKDYH